MSKATDDITRGTIMEGGCARTGFGCLAILALFAIEVGLAGAAGFVVWQTSGAGATPGTAAYVLSMVAAVGIGLAILYGLDRVGKAIAGISPFRLFWEILSIIPSWP